VRQISILVVLGCSSALCFSVGAQQNENHPNPERASASLTAQIQVIRQSYCHVDDESFAANLKLRLTFTNNSEHVVILSRKIESPTIVRVALSAEAGKKDDFVYSPDAHSTVAALPKGPRFGATPNPKLFILLSPGEKFETEVPAAVFGASEAGTVKSRNGLLAKGNYVLQVGVHTWPYGWPYFSVETNAQDIRQRWIKYGDLAVGTVYSNFAPFTLPEHFENPRCP
jgi:hypothetical protein